MNATSVEESQFDLDKRLSLLEQRLDIIQNNHLAHMQEDIDDIKRYFAWGVGIIFVQLIAVIGALVSQL